MITIARNDGTVIIDTLIDTKGFAKGVTDMQSQISRMGSSLKKLGTTVGLAFGIRELVRFGKEAVSFGSDLQEVQNVVDVTFGELSGTVNTFARNALESFGLSEKAAKQYTSTLGAMVKSMGFGVDQAARMSMKLTGLAGDMASFYNLSADEAFAKIRSGISGETEPLKQLGINLSVANLEAFALAQGINKAYNSMSQQEQTILRYNYLLSVTADAQGDFARTSESWANQTRILAERFNQLKATIGKGLIAALTPAVKMLNTLLGYLQKVADAFAAVMSLLFGEVKTSTSSSGGIAGETEKNMEDVAEGFEDASDAADDYKDSTAAAAKEAQRSVMAFDELNRVLAPVEETEIGADGEFGVGESFDKESMLPSTIEAATEVEDKLSPKIQAIVDKIKELIAPLKEIDFGPITEAFERLKTAVEPLTQKLFAGLEWAWYNIFVPLAEYTIEDLIPAFLDLLSAALKLLNAVIESVKPAFEWLWNEFLVPLAEWTGETIIKALQEITDLISDIADVISGDKSFLDFIADLSPAQTVLMGIASALGAIGAALGVIKISSAIGNLTKFFRDIANLSPSVGLIGKLGEVIMIVATGAGTLHEAMMLVFGPGSIIAGISGVVGGAVLAVTNFISMLKNGFSWINEALMLLGIAIAGISAVILGVPATVAAVVAAIVAAVATVVVVVKEHWAEIKAWVSETWLEVTTFLSEKWTEFTTFLSETWTNFTALLSEKWAAFTAFLSEKWGECTAFFSEKWAGVTAFFSEKWTEFTTFLSEKWSAVVTLISTKWEEFTTWFSGILDNIASHFVEFISSVKTKWEEFTTWFKSIWDEVVAKFDEFFISIRTKWEEFVEWVKSIWDEIMTNFGQIPSAFKSAWEEFITWFKSIWDEVITHFREFFEKIKAEISAALDWIAEKIQEIKKKIQEAFEAAKESVDEKFVEPAKEKFQELKDKVTGLFTETEEEITESMSDAADATESEFIEPVDDGFSDLKDNVTNDVKEIGETIADEFAEAKDNVNAKFVEPAKETFNNFTNYIANGFKGAKDSITDSWQTLPGWFSQNVTSPIGGFFNELIESVLNTFQKMADRVAEAIEKLIDSFNRIQQKLSGSSNTYRTTGSISYTTGSIVPTNVPYLAKGSVIPPNAPFLAMLGDQRHGTNVEAPLATIQEAVAMVMEDYIQSNLAGHEATVAVLQQILEAVLGIELDGETISNAVNNYNRKMAVVRGG